MDAGATILIVDDDPGFRRTISDLLREKGYTPRAAAEGKAALDGLKKDVVSVAVIDLRLQDMSGLEVMKEIKRSSPHTECILLTGHASQESAIEAVNLGAYSYVQKPCEFEQLLLLIRRAAEKAQAEQALRESEERYRGLFESSPIALWEQDCSEVKKYIEDLRASGTTDFREYFERHPDGVRECAGLVKVLDVNQSTLDLYEAGTKEELLRGLVQVFTEESYDVFKEELVAIAEGETQFDRETGARTLKGEEKEVALRWVVAPGHEETLSSVVVSDIDITERKRAEGAIKQMAYHDALTGLPNRTLFNDRVAVALAHAARNGQKVAVLLMDLDHFKDVNDTLGHTVGDQLLQAVGERLVALLRESDTVCRMGGDEFLVLLPEMGKVEYAGAAAARILEIIRKTFVLEEHRLRITTSLGIAIYPEDGEDADTLTKNADIAMYRAKEEGRDNYQWYRQQEASKLASILQG